VPPTFEGYRTDVRVVQRATLLGCDNETHFPEIRGGIQIQVKPRFEVPTDPERGKGTLGCIVRRRGDPDRENVYLLSCHHVLHSHGAKDGDNVYHPRAPLPSGTEEGESLGPVQEGPVPGHVQATVPGPPATPGGPPSPPHEDSFWIDAGIARINIDSKCWFTTCTKDSIKVLHTKVLELDDLTDVRSVAMDNSLMLPIPTTGPDVIDTVPDTFPRVIKVGRSTGKTTGVVRNVLGTAFFEPDEGGPTQVLSNVIEIDFAPKSTDPEHLNCKGHKAFAERGDSGAVVVDEAHRVIGMVFLKNANPDESDPLRFRAYACHILPVLDALKVCIPTTPGTSYGTAGALDGSGIAQAKTAMDVPVNEGAGMLSSLEIEPPDQTQPALPEPVVLTDAQRDYMLGLRDALLETPRGRELYATFAEVRREIGYLVRRSRPVKVAWHRNRGPAFLTQAISHLKGEIPAFPREIGGVSRREMLERMGVVLHAHGSNSLREGIERHGPDILSMIDAETVHDCLAALQQMDSDADVLG
jgi:hypothetical protein